MNLTLDLTEIKNLKFEFINQENVVTLVDNQGYEIIKGYGVSIADALNDLLHNLI